MSNELIVTVEENKFILEIETTVDNTANKINIDSKNHDVVEISTSDSGGGGSALTQEQVQDYVAGLLSGASGIGLDYQDSSNNLNINVTGINSSQINNFNSAVDARVTVASISPEEIMDVVGGVSGIYGVSGIAVNYKDTDGRFDIGISGITESQIVDLQNYLTSHPTITNAATDSDNSGSTFIQDILVDSYGHVTGIGTGVATGGGSEINDLSSSVTWTNVPDAYITETSVTQHSGALQITESQIADLQTYLTSFTETNDLSSAVTWVNVPDANITESSVTQHSGALQVTESQVVDLQAYLTSESNDLSSAVTWANVPDTNITESSVVQHSGALLITESQITDLQSYLTSYTETDTLANVTSRGNTTTTTCVIPFLYADQSAFPNATTYHGAIAHSHSDGAMYFAHGGSWVKLANDSDISNSDNWDTAYTIVNNSGNAWTQAYNWGDHGSQGYLTAHPSISAASSSDNSSRTYIQDILLDSNGHVTGIAVATETVTDTDTTYTAGSGLQLNGTTFDALTATVSSSGITTLSNTINTDQDKSLTPKAVYDAGYLTSHPTISNATSDSDNSGNTFIQDLFVDSYGHVTGLNVATASEGGAGGIGNVIEDDSPQLGGDLDLDNNDITGIGDINIEGSGYFTDNVYASGFIKHGGTSSQFLKADGTIDSNTYLTSETNDLSSAVTWANVPDANITESSVTQHSGALQITESQIADLQSYLTSFTETNDLSSAVTWANVPDANITESSVTQHSGALQITESQIADLQSYLTSFTETNDLSSAVTWANVPDANITESSVTQHSGALQITESQIADLQSYLTSFTETNDLSSAVTWANVPDANITESSVTQHSGALQITESQIADLQSYLTSFTETNDLSSAVTWANVPDANITESSVTQHSGALQITESQIADLQSYLTSFTETNDLSSAVTWANVPDVNITESSVTQHSGALQITESQITDLQTYLTAGDNISQLLNDANYVDGSGIANYVAKWSDTDTLTSGLIYDDGTNVGIGTETPVSKLDVSGIITGTSFVKDGGTSSQFLKADGSVSDAFYVQGIGNNTTDIATWTNVTSSTAKSIGSSLGTRFVINNGMMGVGTANPSHLLSVSGSINATTIIKQGGTSSDFLKADGSVDTSTYLTDHPSISAASSSDNSGRTYIQDIVLDSNGHVTGITTATETVTDTNTQLTEEQVEDFVGGMVTGNTETGITVTYQGADGTLDFVVASQTDENFTTADHSKLDGIEAGADVTDTTNVTAAGALMDSEVTNLSQVKAFDSSDYATAAQGTKADTAQQPPSEGAFANGDKTKLDGIEASADVTDTANVVASLSPGTGISISAGGVISVSSVALTTVQTASDQTAHLALTAQEGDVVVRSDENKSYVHNGGSAGTMSDYTLLLTPTDAVLSVAGNTGAVTAAQIKTAYEGESNTNAFTDADHTKLDGIEASADITDTANVTSAGALMDSELTDLAGVKGVTISTLQVKPSEGAFADGDKTKLDGIEASADVTDTANVTSAGALMDSEVTNLAQVKAFDSSDYATAAQGTKADTAQQPPSEGAFADGDKTKLDAIEASADVTDTTNVTAAGALMDSEVTNLAQVKAFDSTDYATAAQGAKADSAQQPPAEGAFVDGDKTKLDGIEASADVTDTTNVTAAGALMDSELASIADVKALDQSVIAGSSPNFVTTNMTDASNKRFMTDAQETKLDSVESSADVTDTTNVTAAGALMDSELTDLAGIKGVTISTLQVKPSEGAFANGDKTKLDGIEASADVTDTANVTSAGALMDSELTDLAGVKGVTISTLQVKPSEGAFANGDKTKLDGIEASADVTDATNVDAAGAVMNSDSSTASMSFVIDEDNMVSNSATKVPTQQSVKAYVDANAGAGSREGGAVFNEDGAAVDFRVEGDTDANLLFVDGSADKVGIGTDSPAGILHVKGEYSDGVHFMMEDTSSTLKTKLYTGNTTSVISVDDDELLGTAYLVLSVGGDTKATFSTSSTTFDQNVTINASTNQAVIGNSVTVFNEGGADVDFRVEGDTDTDLLFVDAGNDIVQIGKLNINGAFTLPTADGSANQILKTDGNGAVSWAADGGGSNLTRGSFILTAPSGTFNVSGGYNTNTLDVYKNGIKLFKGSTYDFEATDGNTFDLTTTAVSGDLIEYVALNASTDAVGNTSLATVSVTSDQTDFSTTDTISSSQLVVFLNGIKLVEGSTASNADYEIISSTSFRLHSAAVSGDVVEYIVYGATVASTNLAKTGDTMTGNLTVNADLIVTGYKETHTDNGNTGTAQTIDISDSTLQTYTLTGNCTFTMPTAEAGRSFTMFIKTGAGSLNATFTGAKFPQNVAPTITTDANRMDIVTFYSDGTNWYGSTQQEYHV